MFLIEIGSYCIVNPAATGVIPLNYFTFPKSASIKSIFMFNRCKATEMGINHGKIRKKKSKSIGFALLLFSITYHAGALKRHNFHNTQNQPRL